MRSSVAFAWVQQIHVAFDSILSLTKKLQLQVDWYFYLEADEVISGGQAWYIIPNLHPTEGHVAHRLR